MISFSSSGKKTVQTNILIESSCRANGYGSYTLGLQAAIPEITTFNKEPFKAEIAATAELQPSFHNVGLAVDMNILQVSNVANFPLLSPVLRRDFHGRLQKDWAGKCFAKSP